MNEAFVNEKVTCPKCSFANLEIKQSSLTRWLNCDRCGFEKLERL